MSLLLLEPMNPIISNKREGPSSQNFGQKAKTEKKLDPFDPKGSNPKYYINKLMENQQKFQIVGTFDSEGRMTPAMIKKSTSFYPMDDVRKLGQIDQMVKESESLDIKKAANAANNKVHARVLTYSALDAGCAGSAAIASHAETLLKEKGVRSDRTKLLADLKKMAANLVQNTRRFTVSLTDSPSESCIRTFLNNQSNLASTAIADRMVQSITAEEILPMNEYFASRGVTHWFFNTIVKGLLDPTIKPDSLFETLFCKDLQKKPYMLVSEMATRAWPLELIGYLLPIAHYLSERFDALGDEDKIFARDFKIPTCCLAHESKALKKDSLGSFTIKIDPKKTQSIPLKEFAYVVVACVSTVYGISCDFRTLASSACAKTFTSINGQNMIVKEVDHPEHANLGVQLKSLIASENLGHKRVDLFNLDDASLFVTNCRGLSIDPPRVGDIRMSDLILGFQALMPVPPGAEQGVDPAVDPFTRYRVFTTLLHDASTNTGVILRFLRDHKKRAKMIHKSMFCQQSVQMVVPEKTAFEPLAPLFGENEGITPDEDADVTQLLISLRRSSIADSLGLNKKVKQKTRRSPQSVSFLTAADLSMLQQYDFTSDSLAQIKSFLVSFQNKEFKTIALQKIIGGLQITADLKYSAISRTGIQNDSSDEEENSDGSDE